LKAIHDGMEVLGQFFLRFHH